MPEDPIAALADAWGIRAARLTRLEGGMNSATWRVDTDKTTYVAKLVAPDQLAALVAGAETAAALAEHGIVTGRPVPTSDGRLVATEHRLALLEHVSGRELAGESEQEQRCIAETLARVHVAGDPGPGPETATFATDWLSPEAPGVEDHPWLAEAIRTVRAETDRLALTWSVLHTDPTPEAFIHDDDHGVTALIDWAGTRRGPVLYDVASAVMYLGGREHAGPFLTAYREVGALAEDEWRRLDAFRRMRWAVQGVYFAGRLVVDDLTGLDDESGNRGGLDDARRGWGGVVGLR